MTTFYWYYMLDKLTNNNRTDWQYFINLSAKSFLNMVSYVVSKQIAINNKEIPG